MFSSIWVTILSLVSSMFSAIGKVMDYVNKQKIINDAKKEQAADIAIQQAEIAKKQADEIIKHQTKEQTESKLDSGKF